MTRNLEPAHLVDPQDRMWKIDRFPTLSSDVVRRYWIPQWSVPSGQSSVQKVLRYPTCNLVIQPQQILFHGPSSGLSTQSLTGTSWAVGTLLQPAGAHILSGHDSGHWLNTTVDALSIVTDVSRLEQLANTVRKAMDSQDLDTVHRLLEEFFYHEDSVPPSAHLANKIAHFIDREKPSRTSQISAEFYLSSRSLQRLCARYFGRSAQWLIMRARVQHVSELMQATHLPLRDIAITAGYSDQPHMTRDFVSVTGLKPGEFSARFR